MQTSDAAWLDSISSRQLSVCKQQQSTSTAAQSKLSAQCCELQHAQLPSKRSGIKNIKHVPAASAACCSQHGFNTSWLSKRALCSMLRLQQEGRKEGRSCKSHRASAHCDMEHLSTHLMAACQSDPVCCCRACDDGLMRPAAASLQARCALEPSTISLMVLHARQQLTRESPNATCFMCSLYPHPIILGSCSILKCALPVSWLLIGKWSTSLGAPCLKSSFNAMQTPLPSINHDV